MNYLEKLQQNPIEKVVEDMQNNQYEGNNTSNTENNVVSSNVQTDTKYITAYDDKTKEYVVYKEAELLDLEKEDYQSENSKISQSADLMQFYSTNKETANQTNGLVWIIPTIVAIISGLAILLKRNRNKKK